MDGIDIGFKVETKIYLHALDGTEIAFNPEDIRVTKDGENLVVYEGDGKKMAYIADAEEDVVDAMDRATLLKLVAVDSIRRAVSEMDDEKPLG